MTGAAAVAAGLSKWLGDVWAARISRNEQSHIDRELERFKSDLSQDSAGQLDALVRKRAVYTRLANRMRIFLNADATEDVDAKQAFLRVYDAACLWAGEPVVDALGRFLDLVQQNSTTPGSVQMAALQAAYRECMLRMRQDSGFSSTSFQYRLVTF